jgi:hypothetical protein
VTGGALIFYLLYGLEHGYFDSAQYRLAGLTDQTGQGEKGKAMPKFVVEREVPAAGQLTADELQGASQVICQALMEMGPEIQWLHSYVTGDRFYCLYIAPDETAVREHAQLSGFPANRISRVWAVIDPATVVT